MPENHRTKPTMTLHMAADAKLMEETDFMQLTEEQLAPLLLEAEALSLGNQTKVLVRDAGGFSLIHVWFKANYPLPRHRHSHDCLYYILSGCAIMGKRTLRPGDSFFVPSGSPYRYIAGPEGVEVLEVRHGAEHSTMDVLETPEQVEKRVAGALGANRELWEQATVSPTFTANVGE
jgi:mannose-6-phosphate isomerase-like protein (cupin superfamily)